VRARTRQLRQQDAPGGIGRRYEGEPGSGGSAGWRRFVRRLGLVIATLGVVVIGWSTYIYFFGDPVTALYQDWRQHQMAHQLNSEFKSFRPPLPLSTPRQKAPSAAAIHAAAERFAHQVHQGDPIGRIEIPHIRVSKVAVNGTRWTEDLSRGPGRYPQSSWPGLGKVTAIAGHRTTFGAPFRHIDELASGNRIVLLMPYGTFTYRVFAHEIVRSNDWSILHKRRFETLVLSACHPLYSASHRWIVFARLISVAAPARVK